MQDQTTGGANLQQPRADLQQNTPNLQQSGTPTSTTNTSSLLSEVAPSGELKVSTATGSSSTITNTATVPEGGSNLFILFLLIIPVLLVVAVFWPRKMQPQEIAEAEIKEAPAPATPKVKKAAKTKKKPSKTKKSGKR